MKNIIPALAFVYHRGTSYATLLELITASDLMIERMKNIPEIADMLQQINFNDFYSAMQRRAEYLSTSYFFPEVAMYFAKPDSIVGNFYERHHACRTRIDITGHVIAGFVNYLKYLERTKNLPKPVPSQKLLSQKIANEWIFTQQLFTKFKSK